MKFTHSRIRENSDATSSYNIEGNYPVRFEELFDYILENSNSFRIEFGSANKEFGGWLGNRIEVSKNNETKECRVIKREPEDWYETIKDLPVVECWANGGWGQMLYIVTFDEEAL